MSKAERRKAIKKANELARSGMCYIEAAKLCGVSPSDIHKSTKNVKGE